MRVPEIAHWPPRNRDGTVATRAPLHFSFVVALCVAIAVGIAAGLALCGVPVWRVRA